VTARAVLVLTIAIAIGGCAAPGVSPSTAPPTAPATAAPPASESVSLAPPAAQPPDALLSVAGGAPTAGALGTYTWLGTGSDAPWLPGAPVSLPPGGAATISFQPQVATAAWSVKQAQPGDADGSTAREIASGSGRIVFSLPPAAGTILLSVDFADNAGTANYFWALSPG
jgi:hypothetical protein